MQIKPPKQINVPYLGALWELYCRMAGIYGAFNTLMLTVVLYSTNDKIRSVFSSYWLFLGFIIILGIIGLLFVYIFLLPSSTIFIQKQSVIDNRNPVYNKICDNEKLLYEIKQSIEDEYEK